MQTNIHVIQTGVYLPKFRLFYIRKPKGDVGGTAHDNLALQQVPQDSVDANANTAAQSDENDTDSEADAIETGTKTNDTVYDNVGGKQQNNKYSAYLVITQSKPGRIYYSTLWPL